jgi:cell wall-associated NlpC family hydrolase
MPVTSHVRAFATFSAMLVAVLLSAVFVSPSSASAATSRVGAAYHVVDNQRGDRYQYGAAGPSRFDCSGLVYYSFRKAGFRNIPRTSSAQAGNANRIRKSSLRKGDLVFFYSGSARARNVYHVGVFAGWRNGHRTIVHAPGSGQRVKLERIWTRLWFAGTMRGRG